MPIAPSNDTQIGLCSVPWDASQKHVVNFANRAAQSAYFAPRIRHTFTNFTYQRKDSVIRVPAHIDTLWDVNYVVYQNDEHPGRAFFAFITKMEYVSEAMTSITIDTDVFQTWFLDCNFLASFVEREHENE